MSGYTEPNAARRGKEAARSRSRDDCHVSAATINLPGTKATPKAGATWEERVGRDR